MDFKFYLEHWKNKFFELKAVLEEAIHMLSQKDKRIEELEKEVQELKTLVDKTNRKKVPKNSKNSNRPPSKDVQKPKRTKAKKKKSNKKTGGQPGHKGHYLEMADQPNKTRNYFPNKCKNCNKKLNQSKATLDCFKQEIDIPIIQPIVTQFNRFEIVCSCGMCNSGKLPKRLTGNIQYGPRIRSFINYASVYQYVPFKRLTEMLRVCFNINLSQGTIFNTLERTSLKMKGTYDRIKMKVSQSDVVGGDETIIFVGGQKWYDWVWQSNDATFITCEPNRKKTNITKHFPNGFPNSILVSDRYKAHLNTPAKGHQICWAHLIRKINYIEDTEPNQWAQQLIQIYKKAKHLETLKSSYSRKQKGSKKTKELEAELTRLLISDIDKNKYPETKKLFKDLKINREKILTFIYHKAVPSHNNASELAIRNAKVKMKISGCFK